MKDIGPAPHPDLQSSLRNGDLKHRMKQASLVTAVGVMAFVFMGQAASPTSPVASSTSRRAPHVFIEWQNTGMFPSPYSQTSDETNGFAQACPEAVFTQDKKDADLTLRMNYQVGRGSAHLYRWQILGKGKSTLEESKANLDTVHIHACRALMTVWQSR